MTEAERPIGQEVCSSPEELASLFSQWKLSPEGQLTEREIAYAVYRVPTASFDLIEPLRDFTFGFYLSQQVFPFVEKYPYPALKIDQRGEEITAAVRTDINSGPRYILAGELWLQKHLNDNHPSTYLINTGVEEFSHWVFEQAIRKRSKDYRESLARYYELTNDNVKRPLEGASVKLEEIESLRLLKYIYLTLTGKIGRWLAETKTLLSETESAILKHSCTLEEYMGIVWQNQVGQKYYPWAKEAKDAKEQLKKVLAYKRQKNFSRQGS